LGFEEAFLIFFGVISDEEQCLQASAVIKLLSKLSSFLEIFCPKSQNVEIS
jgi:hypothetical protein